MPASFTRLPRTVLTIDGEDRRTFLQGLISNDIGKAGPERAIWAAFLTPQGKFLWDLFIAEVDGAFLIDVEAERAEAFRKKLTMYRLRSKVGIAITGELAVHAVFGDGAAAACGLPDRAGAARGGCFVDPRLAEAGLRVYAADDQALRAAGLAEAPFALWDEARIRLGLPDGSRDMPVEKALLLENGFDELGGVDFAKGCYMGQELTARTKYRALVRKRLLPVDITGPVPAPGTPVMAGETEAGEMRSAAGGSGLALLRLEQVRSGQPLTCGQAVLVPAVPAWAVLPEGEPG
jgi:folate-binding protein YgfZ